MGVEAMLYELHSNCRRITLPLKMSGSTKAFLPQAVKKFQTNSHQSTSKIISDVQVIHRLSKTLTFTKAKLCLIVYFCHCSCIIACRWHMILPKLSAFVESYMRSTTVQVELFQYIYEPNFVKITTVCGVNHRE